MAHNISNANGRAEMFYVGETPWHGLGTKVEGAATSAIALEAAGLDWTVSVNDLVTASGLSVPQGKAIVRDDTQQVFGVVGNRYTPVQNRDAFAFLDSLVGEGELLYETAGALGQGERVWMLARVPGELRVAGTDDVTKPYLLLHNAHDGSGTLRSHFTGVRVVCQNTLAMASAAGGQDGVSIRHTGSIHSRIETAREVLGIAAKFFERAQEEINVLASSRIADVVAMKYFDDLIPMPEKPEEQPVAVRNATEIREKLFQLYEDGAGSDMPGVRRTMWAAYNSVTEYVDHVVKTKDRTRAIGREAREDRLASNWFGPGSVLKGQAWSTAMAYATVN
jgi:phage/plasmid-like protein (TIGR03299 family)